MNNVILLGAPGAGKGTQAKIIEKRIKLPQISTGDMLRAAKTAKTPLGNEAEKYMSAGLLLPDPLVVKLMEERLLQSDCQNGFVLDGFPRTLNQAEALDEMLQRHGKKIDIAINIEVPEEELVKRLAGRRTCSQCGAMFHLDFSPPQNEGLCDRCGSALMQRDDDQEITIRKRLKVYQEQTEPVTQYYSKMGLLRRISGLGNIEDIYNQLNEHILALPK